MENWKPVAAFELLYEVSDQGRIRRVNGNVLKPYLRGGYPAVTLHKDGTRTIKAVHLIVLETFVCARPEKRYGAHLDGNAMNAALTNLMWATQRENEAHKRLHGTATAGERSPHAKLTAEQAEIVREIAAAGVDQCRIARLVNMSEDAVSKLVRRISYA